MTIEVYVTGKNRTKWNRNQAAVAK